MLTEAIPDTKGWLMRISEEAVTTTAVPPLEPMGLEVSPAVLDRVRDALAGMKFGQVTIAIHEGKVVQVDRLQQTRIFRKRDR